jgi:hypothetical protein
MEPNPYEVTEPERHERLAFAETRVQLVTLRPIMVIPASENPTPARRPENTRDRVLLTALAIPWLASGKTCTACAVNRVRC